MQDIKTLIKAWLKVATIANYSRDGWALRLRYGCGPYHDDSCDFDTSPEEFDQFGNDIRRSSFHIPLELWGKFHGFPSQQEFVELMRNANAYGLRRVIFHMSGCITIHEGRFFRWLEKQQRHAN